MLVRLLTTLIVFFTPFICHSELLNSDFELWDGDAPFEWSFDSGISVSPTDSHYQKGALAVQVVVNTSNQRDTDFWQTIKIEQGKEYLFSVMVFHTEGNIKARLVIDGYQNYSDAQQINQWQQLTFNYTAESTKEIDVGLRFYDQAGFDGNEIVYIDDFQPSRDNDETSCAEHPVTLTLTTDDYGSETSWELKDEQYNVTHSKQRYESSQTFEEVMCLADGNYHFTIMDTQGDGICCEYGHGSYLLSSNQTILASGDKFTSEETTLFTLGGEPVSPEDSYYKTAINLTGFDLKTALFNIISSHTSQGYAAVWDLTRNADLDSYYEKDGTILDMYSEQPLNSDVVSFTKVTDQCGQYSLEGDCYNREHSFPKSWFGGKVEPMNSDGHHLFATDGYVNSKRSNWPFGEVSNATYISSNGSKLGEATESLGYSGTVFEPIDEFKGDFARAYFYIATRYENVVGNWENFSSTSDAVLDGTSTAVFEPWVIDMLKRWHQNDPVSLKEIDRNNQIFDFQGNRNPFIDHPEFAEKIWGD